MRLFLFFFLYFPILGYAQEEDPVGKQIAYNLKAQQNFRTHEQVFLRTDREFYTAGEDLWFRAWAFENQSLLPKPYSRVLYAELISPENKLLKRLMLALDSTGFAKGDFELSRDLPEGEYRLRAYTNWMRNFGEEVFFEKRFTLFALNKTEASTENDTKKKTHLRFFPEGGYLVEGLPSVVAFQAHDERGEPLPISGEIQNENGEKVTAFEPVHHGMGKFALKPEAGKKYFAHFQAPGEDKPQKIELPAALTSGYTMLLNDHPDGDFRVSLFRSAAKQGTEKLYIAGLCRGKVYMLQTLEMDKPFLRFKIPQKLFPSGVVDFMLFDAQGLPLLERLAFVWRPDEKVLPLSAKFTQKATKKRGKNTLEISCPDTTASLCLSVTDLGDYVVQDEGQTLLAHSLLQADLRGRVYQPASYFVEGDSSAADKRDLLLLTHGWRRFEWRKSLEESKFIPQYPLERGLAIEGKMTKESNENKPIAGGQVFLMIPEKIQGMKLTNTDENGTFLFDGISFTDSARIVLTGKNTKGKNNVAFSLVQIKPHEIHEVVQKNIAREKEFLDFLKKRQEAEYLERLYSGELADTLLADVEIVSTREVLEEKEVNSLGSTHFADTRIKGEDLLEGYTNVMDALRGQVAGLEIGIDGSMQMRGVNTINASTSPLVMVDGIPTTPSTLESIPVEEVKSVEVLKSATNRAAYGLRGSGGVILVYTKKGEGWFGDEEPEGMLTAKVAGFYSARSFYAPNYSKPQKEVRPDDRITLHWQPQVKVGATGKTTVTFYADDAPGEMRVLLEGMSAEGKIGFFILDTRQK